MIVLNRLFDNLFFPLESNEASFLEGVDRHISLMQAANPGIYATLIANTIAAKDAMRAATLARGQEGGQQQGSTIVMNAAKDEFLRFIRVREGLIRSTFEGVNSGPYQEFFPYGLNELDETTLSQMPELMGRIVNVATIYQAELGAQFMNDCIAKRQVFLDARAAQVTNLGENTTLQKAAQQAIRNLAAQLSTNLHTIALDHIGNPDAADDYFEQRYFQRPEVSGLYLGTNAASQTKTVRSQGWTNEKSIETINKGTNEFKIAFANAEGVAIGDGPNTQVVPPGESRTFTAQQMGYAVGNAFLNITAYDNGAIWEVRVSG